MRSLSALLPVCLAIAALGPGVASAAGNVTVSLDAGVLTVEGDAAANSVSVTGASTPDAVTVTGLDGTLVNGGDGVTLAGVDRLLVEMGDGADRVEVRQLTTGGPTTIRLDSGDDVLLVEQTEVRGALRIFGGNGADLVSAGPLVRVNKQLRIKTGRDPDIVALNAARLAGIILVTGPGDDNVALDDLTVDGSACVFTKTGEDDVSVVNTRFFHEVDVNLGADDDVLLVVDVEFDDDTRLDGGDDDNFLELGGFIAAEEDLDIDDF